MSVPLNSAEQITDISISAGLQTTCLKYNSKPDGLKYSTIYGGEKPFDREREREKGRHAGTGLIQFNQLESLLF